MQKKWTCKHCGYCCTLIVRLSFFKFLRILLLGHWNFTEKDDLGKRCIKRINDRCFFLTKKENKPFCRIYNHRPKMCREYPGLTDKQCNKPKENF